jgi:hypothetical protein
VLAWLGVLPGRSSYIGGDDVGGVCDTRSHVVSERVEEVWLMPGT